MYLNLLFSLFTAVTGFIVGCIGAFIYENLPFSKIFGIKKLIIRGYKFHHSLYGLLLILMALLFHENSIFFVSSGLGVIAEHYLTGGGFDFITKEKN